jgi:small subunit ribosomal protein S19
MSRSLWKGPYFAVKVLTNTKYISRASLILPSHVNKTFEIHNGKRMIKVFVTPKMIGHKFGEFSPTKVKKTVSNPKN